MVVNGSKGVSGGVQTMTPEHPKWREFYGHLSEMLSFARCDHTLVDVGLALGEAFSFTPEEIAASFAYFEKNRVHCSCEVLLRFGLKAMDDIVRLQGAVRALEQRLSFLEQERGLGGSES